MPDYGVKINITNGDDYDHAIILNTAMPNLKPGISRERVVGLAFEPPKFLQLTSEFVEYAKRYIGNYYIGDATGLPAPFKERYSHMWYNPPLQEPPKKSKVMSIMVSEKMGERGHLYRHELVNKILETELPIDIWGRGCKFYSFMQDERVKGDFKEIEPYQVYQFHICIENFQLNEYFSEKIMNPLLCSTTPIYLGCNNIENYFPNNVIALSGDVKTDLELLTKVCENPDKYMKSIDVENVKNVIYLLRNLDNIFGPKQSHLVA
jgi:hypothetical protein